jgi:hypothetical protein
MKKTGKLPLRCPAPLLGAAFLFLISMPGYAQEAEMADTMRSEGKIYVVVAILVLILLGLVGYLVMIDRKTTRLERKIDQNKPS